MADRYPSPCRIICVRHIFFTEPIGIDSLELGEFFFLQSGELNYNFF